MKKLLVLLPWVALLSACGGDEASVTRGEEWTASRQGLVYAYPRRDQRQVPRTAPVLLRFSSALEASFPEQAVGLKGVNGDAVAFDLIRGDDGRTLILRPTEKLAPMTDYRVSVGALPLADGDSESLDYEFRTRARAHGPPSETHAPGDFRVARWVPDGERWPLLDFSSIRLQFSRPLDPGSLQYGDSVRLDGPDGLVAARLLVGGSRVTLDPLADLQPGASYELTLGTGIRDHRGNAFAGDSKRFVPRASGSRSYMVQKVPDSDSGTRRSPLSGKPINRVPLSALLLGHDNSSQQSGDLRVELAHIPSFPDTAPLRIPRATLLEGTAMDVMIAGQVPAGFDSGKVSIRFLSDAIGFMEPNPWNALPEAPRQITLYMDVAISSEDPRASGAVTQDLLHLELVGSAIVKDGELVVDAVSVAEPRIMGVETARSLLSFHMRSYRDQQRAPIPDVDTRAPSLASWIPGDRPGIHRPHDPIVLQFSEPLDGASLTANQTLTLRDSTAQSVAFSLRRDGAAVILKPEQPLRYDETYQVVLNEGITDLAGNGLAPRTLSFTMPKWVHKRPHAPIVLSVQPGFPCIPEDFDLAVDDAGRCLGGQPSDDHLPLPRHAANRGLRVVFSRPPDPATVNAQTFMVERINAAGQVQGPVAGRMRLEGRVLTFMPDQPWESGALYRYTLRSTRTFPDCGVSAICDVLGLPLQTRLLAATAEEAVPPLQGGPDLALHFRAVEPVSTVRQQLLNRPTADVNNNFRADSGEPVVSDGPAAARNSTRIARNPAANPDNDGTAASGTALADVNVGCGFGDSFSLLSCPDAHYAFVNSKLNVDVAGYVPPEDIDANDADVPDPVKARGGVLVYINPTHVMLSGITVHPRVSDGAAALQFEAEPSKTGPQVLRIRYTCDPAEEPCGPPDYGRVRGWIVEQNGQPVFMANLDLYLDAPRLDPIVNNHNTSPPERLDVKHDLRSRPLALKLSGGVTFLDDGRLLIEQSNDNVIPLDVEVDIENGLLSSVVHLAIPVGESRLDFVSPPAQQ